MWIKLISLRKKQPIAWFIHSNERVAEYSMFRTRDTNEYKQALKASQRLECDCFQKKQKKQTENNSHRDVELYFIEAKCINDP